MKVPSLIILFCALFLVPRLIAQVPMEGNLKASFDLNIRGKVFNEENGSPIPNHDVYVVIDSLGIVDTLPTDVNGFYSDTIPNVPGPGIPVFVGTLDCHNVMHSQTVMSLPVPITVNFSICDSTAPIFCDAAFIFVLDTFNAQSNTYRFYDSSTGGPDLWFWSFGDGTSSHEKNPVHSYEHSGTYKVCLTIIVQGESAENCMDSTYQMITTPMYLSLGGQVYAGGNPINNPEPQGDTGVAYIYRQINGNTIPIDTSQFSYLGYYAFPSLLPGDYLVRIELTSGSTHFADYFPGYYPSALTWQVAEPLSLTGNLFHAAISLTVISDTLSGIGNIKGMVVDGDSTVQMHPLSWQEIILMDDTGKPFRFTYSGALGMFEFTELPFGTYSLKVESTAKFSRAISVTLTEQNPLADSILLERFGHDVTSIQEPNPELLTIGNPYPNPSFNQIQWSITSPSIGKMHVHLLSVLGQPLAVETILFSQGRSTHSLALDKVPSGFYYLVLTSEDGALICTKKILKL